MEECLFFQDIVDSLGKLRDFIDVCFSQEGNNDVIWKKQQTLTTIMDRIISLMTRKDKSYQLLNDRNKMLETRIKTIAHQLRAMDKMTQIPEVPSLFQVKEENNTIPDIEMTQEEEIQLSVIPEITEIENTECKSSEINEATFCGNVEPASPSNLPLNRKPPTESNLLQWREPPKAWREPRQFETSTPKESGEAKRQNENQVRRIFPPPNLIARPFIKSLAKEIGECCSSKDINNQLIRRPTIEIDECSKSRDTNYLFSKRPTNANGESCSSKDIDVNVKERGLTFDSDKKHLQKEIPDNSVKEIQPNQYETITIKDNSEQTMYSDISSDEDFSDESKKAKLRNKEAERKTDQGSEGDTCDTRKHKVIDLKSQDNSQEYEEALNGRRPIRNNADQQNKESTDDEQETQSIEAQKGEDSDMDDIDENDLENVDKDELPDTDDVERDDGTDELDDEDESTEDFKDTVQRRLWGKQESQLELTGDEIELTATQIEELQDITQWESKLSKPARDRNEEIIRHNDEAIAKMKETIENIAENTFKRRKTDVTDTKQEMKIVNYIKENLIIKSNEVPDRRQEVSQSIDLLTVKNYDSSSADDITILDNPDDNNFIENSNDNIGNGKVFNTVTKIGNPKIECITTRRPINQHHNSKEYTKNVQKLEEPKQNDNGEQNTKNMLKSDEPKTKDEITQLENKYADNTFNPDDTPQIVDEISGGTSTILSLTSKSVVHRNGDLLNILSKSFMNIKQMQNQENMPSERHVVGNIKKAIVENATNAVNKVTSTNICKEMEGINSGQTNKQDNKDSTNKTKERQVKRSHESEEENHEKRNTNDASEATKDATTVECVEKEQSQMAKNVNENKSKMQEVKGLKKLNPAAKATRSKESIDSNNEEENLMSKVEEELQLRRNLRERKKKLVVEDNISDTEGTKEDLQPRQNLRGRRKKVAVLEDSSDTEGDEFKLATSKKAPKVQQSKSKTTANQTENRKDEEEQSDHEEPIRRRGRPKKQAGSKTKRSGK